MFFLKYFKDSKYYNIAFDSMFNDLYLVDEKSHKILKFESLEQLKNFVSSNINVFKDCKINIKNLEIYQIQEVLISRVEDDETIH